MITSHILLDMWLCIHTVPKSHASKRGIGVFPMFEPGKV